jgi:XrtJ-associated TM-motif-TM protein
MKKTCLSLAAIALLFVALPVYAQDDDGPGGCDNSPENPTAILAVVGSAGALLASLRARVKVRKDSSK